MSSWLHGRFATFRVLDMLLAGFVELPVAVASVNAYAVAGSHV